jgi:hypothetical protein
MFSDPVDARLDAGICGIVADDFGEHDVIEIAAARQTASAPLHRMVRTETAIGPSCPLVEMAREQGAVW